MDLLSRLHTLPKFVAAWLRLVGVWSRQSHVHANPNHHAFLRILKGAYLPPMRLYCSEAFSKSRVTLSISYPSPRPMCHFCFTPSSFQNMIETCLFAQPKRRYKILKTGTQPLEVAGSCLVPVFKCVYLFVVVWTCFRSCLVPVFSCLDAFGEFLLVPVFNCLDVFLIVWTCFCTFRVLL